MKKKLVIQGLIRGGIVLVCMGISLYFSMQSGDEKQTQSILAATIISVALAAFSVIYDYDVWTVKKKIIAHTICMLFTVYPTLIISGWFDTSQPSGYLTALLSFVIFGVIGASIGYLVSKYVLKNVPEHHK
ncbi:DUF3021 family protein [Macrococcus animalis]|uniref:DUF3021 family protein n=1 Tax=Macrococcus animalis TaxID=3395467 RepID=UPI0039BDB20C